MLQYSADEDSENESMKKTLLKKQEDIKKIGVTFVA